MYDLKIPPGSYSTIEQFLTVCNNLVDKLQIKRLKNVKVFDYDHLARKFIININESMFMCLLVKNDLIDLLGLERGTYISNQVVFIGSSKPLHFFMHDGKKCYFRNQRVQWKSDSPLGGICPYIGNLRIKTTMLLYSNIVKDQIFGSQFTNLLRAVAIDGGLENERIVVSFKNRIYLPLKFDRLIDISVSIRDFQRRKMDFQTDNVYILLHFRPCKQ